MFIALTEDLVKKRNFKMRAVIQRVSRASVKVGGVCKGACENGLLVLLCAAKGDTEEDALKMCRKICNLRIFKDSEGRMNRSVLDIGGGILTVPNFTLLADCKGGNRPDFFAAEEAGRARELFEHFLDCVAENIGQAPAGVFGAEMEVELVNDGPVTIILDSEIFRKR